MWLRKFCFICVFLVVNTQDYNDDDFTTTEKPEERKLSETILALIEHYKQPNPIGLPEVIVPEPSPMPDSRQPMAFGNTMYFKNTALYGASKFHILNITADIKTMEIHGSFIIDKLQSRGNYTMASWFDSVNGPFTVNATGLNITACATLGVQTDGQLQVQDVNIDLVLDTFTTNFENIGLLGGIFQSTMNSGGTFFFDSMKPYMLADAYTNIRTDINAKLDKFVGDMQFPNTIPILDMVIINARNKIREIHLDPYRIKDFNETFDPIKITLSNTWIHGLSNFERVGNITLKIENNTAEIEFELGTKQLGGTTQWTGSALSGLISKEGTASFSVEYVSTQIILEQPLDTRKKPVFKYLRLDVGNIQARSDGFGTIDYVIEAAVNILPNLLRYQIIGALEGPLKEKVQEELNKLDVENTIKNELPRIDAMQDMKLSDLIGTNTDGIIYDEDEFFNF